jgi:UDP-N-acetylmuramyl pentapeptide phosphotransferase/UDP-N-acetylglucosamine-1-phosphate transferase
MKDLLVIVLPVLATLIMALLTTPLWIKISARWQLVDRPDDRKHHRQVTPGMGGVTIFLSLTGSFLLLCEQEDWSWMNGILAAAILLFLTGFFDDLLDLSPLKKFILQVAAAYLVCYNGVVISDWHGFLGLHTVPEPYATAFTMLVIVFFTNAYNFIDGIDGLAASLGAISSFLFGMLAFRSGLEEQALFSFCLTGALLGFLYYNRHPARLFMGDTGSLTVGFLLIVTGIRLIQQHVIEHPLNESATMCFVFAVLFIPVFDMLRVIVIRMVTGSSPMKPDRNHLHHMIGRQHFGHHGTCFLILVFNLLLILFQEHFRFMHINYFVALSLVMGMLVFNSYFIGRVAEWRNQLLGSSPEFSHLFKQ